jgi:hypothetical protein
MSIFRKKSSTIGTQAMADSFYGPGSNFSGSDTEYWRLPSIIESHSRLALHIKGQANQLGVLVLRLVPLRRTATV